MKISYLPIFLAVTTCLVFGTSAQHTRVLRDVDVMSSVTDFTSLLSMLGSMMMPSEVFSMITSEVQQIFSSIPGLSLFNGLNPGRKRRAIYPWARHVKNAFDKEVNHDKYVAPRLPEYSDSLLTGKKAEKVPESFFPGQAESRLFTRSVATTLQEVSAADEGSMGADMATKGMEMAQAGAEGMGSVMKGGEMMGQMASNAASAGQQMAEATGKGAEVIAKGAEMFQAGAAQASEMATSFGRK